MQLGIVTLFPEMFAAVTEHGISGRAVRSGLMNLELFNPRDYTTDKHRTVDDKPFGGGPGMLMKTKPLIASIAAARQAVSQKQTIGEKARVIYLSPQGQTLKQGSIIDLAKRESMVLLCGRYQGIDNRVLENEIDEEWLLLIYIKNNSPDEGIIIEDKTNSEKNSSHEFMANEIFKASDLMVDSLTQLIARKRAKKD